MTTKKGFFDSHGLKEKTITLDDGTELDSIELNAEQREEFLRIYTEENSTRARAYACACAYSLFSEDDIPKLLKLSGDLLIEMSDKIMQSAEIDEKGEGAAVESAKND